jgi:membrane fusion protein (multidrug efflux system)
MTTFPLGAPAPRPAKAPPLLARTLRSALPFALPFALALATALLAGCGRDEARAEGGATRDDAIPVTTTEVTRREWNDSLQAVGTVRALESVEVTAKVSETVQRVHFDSGEAVRAGAPLVTLSGSLQQAELAEARAAANEAERLYNRLEGLAGQQLVASAQLDTQRATRDAARARVAQVQAQLGDRVVRAPFAGVLGIRQVSPGALVTPGTVIATLDAIERVHVDFPVPEQALPAVDVGNRVLGRSAAWPTLEFSGEVETIGTRIDPDTRALTVRAEFPNPDRRLRPGMLMEVRMLQPARDALVVPEISVVQVGRESFVFRVRDDGVVERAPVQTGSRQSGAVVITDGVAAGDRIVVDGTGKLRDGVRVVEAGADTAPTDEGGGATDGAAVQPAGG